ncbi:MAG: glucose dehydrogenase, partial [Planctomycetota bacterium]
MMRGLTHTLAAGALTLGPLSSAAIAQVNIDAERFATGLARPVFVTHAPGDFDRVFVLEQRSGTQGRIRVLDRETGAVNPAPFLTLTVSTGSEQGLLGMAFHPNYNANGLFYVNYTRSNGDTIIAEYSVNPSNPDVAVASTARTIMVIDQPFANHNAG